MLCDGMLRASSRLMVDRWGEFDLLGGVERGKGEGDCIPGLHVPLLVIGNRLWRQVRRAGGFMRAVSASATVSSELLGSRVLQCCVWDGEWRGGIVIGGGESFSNSIVDKGVEGNGVLNDVWGRGTIRSDQDLTPKVDAAIGNGAGGETVVRQVRRLGNGGEVSNILQAGFGSREAADSSIVLNIADSSGALVV